MATTLRHLHRFMANRLKVQLDDGRAARIVRVDTVFPTNETTVTVWTAAGPSVAKVKLTSIVGEAQAPVGEQEAR
jgi:hypothetical protein